MRADTVAKSACHVWSACRALSWPALVLAVASAGCGLTAPSLLPGGATEPLSAAEVNGIVSAAAASLRSGSLVIAVTDREGQVLGVFKKPDAPELTNVLLAERDVEVNTAELAVSLARSGAFFSNDQAPLSSRTVRFISRRHFPPTFSLGGRVTGVKKTPSGALWDIENTNRGCALSGAFNPGMAVAPARSIDRSGPGLGIATVPGGVPLFKMGKLVGGVGVAGAGAELCEFAAFAGSTGFGPIVAPPGEIFIDGVRLPFVEQTRRPLGAPAGEAVGEYMPIPDLTDPSVLIAGAQSGLRSAVPEGWLVGPESGPLLSEGDVRSIIENAVFQANKTRAAIRLPLRARTKMVMAVTSVEGEVLGLFRMADATVFSIDVAATKARNVAYLSSLGRSAADLPGVPLGTAVTTRTLRFGSQPFFPPGIGDSLPGPFTNLRLRNQEAACSQGLQPPGPNQSGIVLFPGSAPLYRFGVVLVGGFGVSGDGVDQDDLVTAAGSRGYEAAPFLRADRLSINGVPLPYMKFPRASEE